MSAPIAVSFFDQVTDYVGSSPVTYAVVFAVSAIDAFLPLVPSETVVITAGTLAASGDLVLYLVIPAAFLGAFVGDNISYALGDQLGERLADRLVSRERLRWARRLLERSSALILIVARFIPGGRTATTFAAGTVDFAWRRFVVFDAIAVVVWATYATLIGYLGGTAFDEDIWKALALGFGIALVISGVVELVRRGRVRP